MADTDINWREQELARLRAQELPALLERKLEAAIKNEYARRTAGEDDAE